MADVLHMFNAVAGGGKSLIRKALDSATGVGEALIPQKLEQVLTNTIVQLSAEMALVETEFDNQKRHEFNRITALPGPGGAMGESGTTPSRRSNFTRTGVDLKVVRRKGEVSNFLQDASAKNLDALAAEMENHLLVHSWDLVFYNIHGNAGANPYEYSGWDTFITTYRRNTYEVPTSLQFLDDMIDSNTRRGGARHKKAFLMSPEMLSLVSRLITNVRNNQNPGPGLVMVDIAGGWRLQSYRGIPIVESTSVKGIAAMSTVTATPAATGGSLADADYSFVVAPVTYKGEQLASAIANATVSGGSGNGKVTLSWTAWTPSENQAMQYRIYGKSGTTTDPKLLPLLAVIPAFTYDSNGAPNGDKTSYVVTTMTPVAASVSTAMEADRPYVYVGGIAEEAVYLIDLDKYQGMGKQPYTNTGGNRFNGLVTLEPLAKTDDFLPFLIKSYTAMVDAFQATCAVTRGLRVK